MTSVQVQDTGEAAVRKVNTSAFMAQRVEPHDSLDDFPTPPWAVRALTSRLAARHYRLADQSVWEPACNRGYMARPLSEAFGEVIATDVHDYSGEWPGQQAVQDFLLPWPGHDRRVDWVITNPPFRLAEQFLERAMQVAEIGVALLLRTQWLHGVGRWRDIFGASPVLLMPFAERVPMVKGRIDPDASTATDYSWFVFLKDMPFGGIDHIAPCRAELERPADYAPPVPPAAGGLLTIMEDGE